MGKSSQMGAKHAGVVGRGTRSVVANGGVLAERDADADNLLSDLLHVVFDEVVAIGMEEDGETPGVLEGYEVRLARVEIEVHDLEGADLLLGHLGAFQALSERARRHCYQSIQLPLGRCGAFVRVVQIRKAPLYRRRSKSAMMQSIMCGFGVRK